MSLTSLSRSSRRINLRRLLQLSEGGRLSWSHLACSKAWRCGWVLRCPASCIGNQIAQRGVGKFEQRVIQASAFLQKRQAAVALTERLQRLAV